MCNFDRVPLWVYICNAMPQWPCEGNVEQKRKKKFEHRTNAPSTIWSEKNGDKLWKKHYFFSKWTKFSSTSTSFLRFNILQFNTVCVCFNHVRCVGVQQVFRRNVECKQCSCLHAHSWLNFVAPNLSAFNCNRSCLLLWEWFLLWR